MSSSAQLTLRLDPGADSDPAELDELGRRLREQLLDAGADSVDAVSTGAAPAGTKAIEMFALGSLLVAVGRSAAALRTVVTAVRDWIGTQPVRSVTIALDGDTLAITGASEADQHRLVEAWIARHAAAGD
jgi:hypothetical protein